MATSMDDCFLSSHRINMPIQLVGAASSPA